MRYYKLKDISTGITLPDLNITCLMDAIDLATPGKHEILVYDDGVLIETKSVDIHRWGINRDY